MADVSAIPLEPTQVRSRRGENNHLRKGTSKIHRRYRPALCCSVPRGAAAKVVARMSSHDWHRNDDLIELRRQGYVPYTQRGNPHFSPKPMRVSARSESCEALNVLSLALAANCDYNPDSDTSFEIMMPFEAIARAMGVLHVYENGRKAYDVALHALSVLEQLGYVIVLHDQDSDSGQNKPLRIWLTETFFTSRGIHVEEIRQWLGQFRSWAIRKGLTESLRKKYERHLLRIERMGLDLNSRHSLRNRLKQIKRWVVSPDLQKERERVVETLAADVRSREEQSNRLDWILDETASNIKKMATARKLKQNPYYQAYVRWATTSMPHVVARLESTLKMEQPGLLHSDPEAYYRLLLERAGIPI